MSFNHYSLAAAPTCNGLEPAPRPSMISNAPVTGASNETDVPRATRVPATVLISAFMQRWPPKCV
jgi:hypothetical protein